ncbi:hypothetical protein ASPZODRAFT_132915 [Penicilliopsis zonata CBS 506.65]|uniref:Uncharacterized protein n=1 Tax=Penicilliopsis zonata CBS 506.65 TaxID=1073090 RepID=A0A1L9SI06_9EURO|nr:hypothetical protein ASPZODRAFT_132915 [Penicilliopsis zonata CBS 506.65]OJJ46767.1 hypothetical protein ASPZODRAFT_132915 [Penicilliopsis zonata CBS 506.65]
MAPKFLGSCPVLVPPPVGAPDHALQVHGDTSTVVTNYSVLACRQWMGGFCRWEREGKGRGGHPSVEMGVMMRFRNPLPPRPLSNPSESPH